MEQLISVIIPTYKEPDYLDLCLKSAIEGQTHKNQIIVVVDGHYELNKTILEKYKESIECIIFDNNQGLSRATNVGVYNSRYENILIVNDDNVFPNRWDSRLPTLMKNSIVSPNQIEPNPSMFRQFIINDLGKNITEFDLTRFWEFEQSLQSSYESTEGSTLPIYMKKLDFIKIGGWDENYPSNGVVADWDFFLKANLSDFQLYRTKRCHFYHFAQITTGNNRRSSELEAHEYSKYKWGTYIKHNATNNEKYL